MASSFLELTRFFLELTCSNGAVGSDTCTPKNKLPCVQPIISHGLLFSAGCVVGKMWSLFVLLTICLHLLTFPILSAGQGNRNSVMRSWPVNMPRQSNTGSFNGNNQLFNRGFNQRFSGGSNQYGPAYPPNYQNRWRGNPDPNRANGQLSNDPRCRNCPQGGTKTRDARPPGIAPAPVVRERTNTLPVRQRVDANTPAPENNITRLSITGTRTPASSESNERFGTNRAAGRADFGPADNPNIFASASRARTFSLTVSRQARRLVLITVTAVPATTILPISMTTTVTTQQPATLSSVQNLEINSTTSLTTTSTTANTTLATLHQTSTPAASPPLYDPCVLYFGQWPAVCGGRSFGPGPLMNQRLMEPGMPVGPGPPGYPPMMQSPLGPPMGSYMYGGNGMYPSMSPFMG